MVRIEFPVTNIIIINIIYICIYCVYFQYQYIIIFDDKKINILTTNSFITGIYFVYIFILHIPRKNHIL